MNKLAGNNSTFVFCDIVESVEIDSIRITERSGKKLLDQSDVYLFIHSCILDKITEVELIDKLQNEFNLNLDDYKGFFGLRKLALELKKEFQPDFVADLHNVLRTKILSFFFKKAATLDKGRIFKS